MKKLIITALVLGAAIVVAGTAEAGGRRCRTYAPVAVQQTTATARVENGYRAFSYQPGATNVGVVRRTTRAPQPGYMNAGTKALGKY